MRVYLSESQLESRLGWNRSLYLRTPTNHSFSTFHTIEIAAAAIGVSSHSAQAEPISHLQVGWNSNIFGNDVHPITGHSE